MSQDLNQATILKLGEGRVLFLAQYVDHGGVSVHMLTLARALQARGWKVAVASRSTVGPIAARVEHFESQGVRHYMVPFPSRICLSSLKQIPRAHRSLGAAINDFHPTLLHVHWRSTSLFAQLQRHQRRMPFVTTLHQTSIPMTPVYRLVSFWGDQAIAVSSDTRRDLLERFGVAPSRVQVVFNGVDQSHFRPALAEEREKARVMLDVPSDTFTVAIIASLSDRKRHDLLVEALARLRADGIDAILLIAGAGQRGKIERTASHLGVLSSFVLPSDQEAFPLVIAEAMSCAVVPIRTPAGGATDQITDGVNGFIVPFDDPEAISSRLRLLSKDEVLRHQMGQQALRTARQRFGQQVMVKKTIDIYEQAVSAR